MTSFSKYRLIAELGHGGMADVFLAVQAGPAGSGFSKLTVIKRLRANLAEDPEFVSMLVDEARISARLNHPNVVQTNEVGEVDRQYYIAMEYLDGQPFHRIQHRAQQRAKDGASSPLTKAMQYVVLMDALAGLHHAHELADYDGSALNIVHRDMTPHNIFVTYEGQVKVVDFGIAKAQGRASETRQGIVKGKVRYMAPEQAIGQDIDRRADIFAAGILLWEIATGRRMWRDKDDLRIVQELVTGEIPASPREIDPEVPEAIDKICRRALATKAADRYQTAEDLRGELEQYLADCGQLVEARRKLAAVIAELFKDKRAEIRSVIEKQLSVLSSKATSSGAFETAVIATDSQSGPLSSRSRTPTSAGPVSVSVPEGVTGVTEQQTEVYRGRPRGRGPAVYIALGAAAIATALAVTAWRSAVTSQARAQMPSAAASASGEASSAPEISLRLTGGPVTAVVRIDDGPPRSLPVDLKVPKDDREHRLSIEAEGYVTRFESVRFARDVVMSVDLAVKPSQKAGEKGDPKKPAAPPPAAPPARTPPVVVKGTSEPTEAAPQPASSKPPPKGNGRLAVDPNLPWP